VEQRGLSKADEAVLLRRAKRGDRAAQERLVKACKPLIRAMAWRYESEDIPFEDLLQDGQLAVLEAIARYDLGVGARLSTYAKPLIAGAFEKRRGEAAREGVNRDRGRTPFDGDLQVDKTKGPSQTTKRRTVPSPGTTPNWESQRTTAAKSRSEAAGRTSAQPWRAALPHKSSGSPTFAGS
jgi:DNA-directed RNA polymerase specialized sigma24 family protein